MSDSSTLHTVLGHLERVRGPDRGGWYSARCPRSEFHKHGDRSPSLRLNHRGFRCLQPACPLHAGGPLRALARELGVDAEPTPQGQGTGQGERAPAHGEFTQAAARSFIEETGLPWEAAEQLGVQFDRVRCAIAFTWPGLEIRKLRLRRSAEPRFVWSPAGAESRPSLWPRVGRETVTGTRVVLAEGERDTLALRALGLEAFSVTGGAGSPPSFEDLARLLALGVREFWVAYDADAAGLEGAEKCRDAVYRAARHLGLRVNVRSLPLPGAVVGSGGKDWTDAVQLLGKEELARHLHGAGGPPRAAAQLLTAADLLSQPDDEGTTWLVDGLLPAGGLSVLVAKPKTGKSTLARALAVAVAQGREFLGRRVRQGPVLLLALEERPADVRRHLRQLGLKPEDPLLVAFDLGPKQLEQLQAWVVEHQPVLIGVDPLVRAVRVADISAYAEVARALEGLVSLAHTSEAHLMLSHHAPKLSDERAAVDAPLGTTAISGAVDVVLHLKRTPEGRRFLSSVQRVGEDLPEVEVALGDDGWPCLGRTREEVEDTRVLGAILEFVEANPGATRAEVLEGVPGSQNLKVRVLHRLVQEGKLACAGTGKRGDPFRYTLGSVSVLRTEYVPGTESTETASGPKPAPDLHESRTRLSDQTGPEPEAASTESGGSAAQGGQGACPRCGEPEALCCCPDPEPGPGGDPLTDEEAYLALEREALLEAEAGAPSPPAWALEVAEALPGTADPVQVAGVLADLLEPPLDPATLPPEAKAPRCRCCGGRRWWQRPRSHGGGWVCARCHPPRGVKPAAWHGPDDPPTPPEPPVDPTLEDQEAVRARRRQQGLCEGCGGPVAVLGGRRVCSRCGWKGPVIGQQPGAESGSAGPDPTGTQHQCGGTWQPSDFDGWLRCSHCREYVQEGHLREWASRWRTS